MRQLHALRQRQRTEWLDGVACAVERHARSGCVDDGLRDRDIAGECSGR
jgi:hypothetical protein